MAATTVNMIAPTGVVAAGNCFWPDGSSTAIGSGGIVAVPILWQSYALNAGFQEIPGGDGATLTVACTNPATTVSTTPVMAGLGAQATPAVLTPKASTRINLSIEGQFAQATSGDGITITCRWGTGAAPAQGTAASGTQIGNSQTFTAVAAAHSNGFCIGGILTGLTPGTQYWFDLTYQTVTGGTASLTGLTVEAFEM